MELERITTIILGGGQGKRLFPLTRDRSKPAVPIGGKYRLVDIPISNSINSGLRRIFVLTQFNSTSLHRHIHRAYPYEYFHQTSVELLVAEQTLSNTDWFQGTADAVRKHLPHYHLENSEAVLILSGDHLYRMDYRTILHYHQEKNADVTIVAIPVLGPETKRFGILKIEPEGNIVDFLEKPQRKEDIRRFNIPPAIRRRFKIRAKGERYLASIGVYVFKPRVLEQVLQGHDTDFGKEVIPKAIGRYQVLGYIFNGYWRDIGTISAFYQANLELTKEHPPFNFFAPYGRIFTRARFLPPAHVENTTLDQALVAEGCLLKGATIERSVIGLRSVVREGTLVRKSVIMGNDFYEMDSFKTTFPQRRKIPLGIGKGCHLERCIVDKNARIGDRVIITNAQNKRNWDGENYYIRDGIVIIPRNAEIPHGTKI